MIWLGKEEGRRSKRTGAIRWDWSMGGWNPLLAAGRLTFSDRIRRNSVGLEASDVGNQRKTRVSGACSSAAWPSLRSGVFCWVQKARFQAGCEPSVHGARARWSLEAASNQQAATQHAKAHGWSRGVRRAVAEGSGLVRRIGKTPEFREEEEIGEGSRDGLGGGRRGRLRQGGCGREGWCWSSVAAAFGGGRDAAGFAGIIQDGADHRCRPCLPLHDHADWQ